MAPGTSRAGGGVSAGGIEDSDPTTPLSSDFRWRPATARGRLSEAEDQLLRALSTGPTAASSRGVETGEGAFDDHAALHYVDTYGGDLSMSGSSSISMDLGV